MRYVSEQFKEKQNQLIRPPLKLYFEVATKASMSVWFSSNQAIANLDDFDENVAPIAKPKNTTNEYYYAVVGDGKGVDDPNRMCASEKVNGEFPTPTHSVPAGVLDVASVNEEMLIGSTVQYYFNIVGIPYKLVLSFKGGLIPESVRVEVYDADTNTWSTEQTIDNSDLKEEIEYVALSPSDAGKWRRFYLKNTTKGGRYQFNYFKINSDLTVANPVVFENDYVNSVSVSEATDLTSQTMPSYDMTVVCLDFHGEYAPDTSYWENCFKEGKACLLKVGYEIGDDTEYLDFLYGLLTAQPDYEQGKITFKASVGFNSSFKTIKLSSIPNSSLSTGDVVDSKKFSSFLSNYFDSSDIIKDATDDNNTKTNLYEYIRSDARQLIANAVGGYITAGINTFNLYDTCGIQYRNIDGYLPRYDQVKCSLQSRSKVGTIEITRSENTLSSDYVDVEAVERVSIPVGNATARFILPYWAFGKVQLINAQPSDSSAVISIATAVNTETVSTNGEVVLLILFRSNTATTIKPIVRFFSVNTTKYQENESIGSSSSDESYTNDNDLVTNAYVANRVKRVARFMSDVSNQYEVDVVQDLRYELGDVIRLETEKNVFKTCVVTALQFNLPGSKGHVTCRKIFSLMDSAYAVPDPQGSLYVNFPTGGYYYVGKNDGMAIFGTFTYSNRCFFYGLGFSTFTKTPYGAELSINKKLVDLNGHEWGVFFYNVDNSYTTNNPCVIELPDYDPSSGANANSWGAIELIKALYNEQKMTPPVDYTCTLVNP